VGKGKSQHVHTELTPGLKGAAWQSGLDAGRAASGRYAPLNPYEGHYPGVVESVRTVLESIWAEAYRRGCEQRAEKEAEGEATDQG
jgi:hypothetical protein